ncbi:MAG TPA: malate dehydrogenase [Spirochaetia bacterium]|nr:malate dehydrogenase [Spirochaetia bacterium]
MAHVGIVGSGNVGANTAFFIAEKGVADVQLYDIQEGLSTGKALDMMEAAPIRGYKTKISGTDRRDILLKSEIIIITAGAVRQPGQNREDLYDANRGIVEELADSMKGTAAKIIMVTEPVDLLTALFVKRSGVKRRQVMGLGGMLDSTRLRYLIAHELGLSFENVSALVVGRHSSAMIPLPEYCSVSGIPISRLLPQQSIERLFDQTRRAGDLIVTMAQRASAYYGPSAAAADLAEAIHLDTGRVVPVSVVLQGEYGVNGVAMNLPVVIGRNGIEQVLQPRLTPEQKSQFVNSANDLATILARS